VVKVYVDGFIGETGVLGQVEGFTAGNQLLRTGRKNIEG